MVRLLSILASWWQIHALIESWSTAHELSHGWLEWRYSGMRFLSWNVEWRVFKDGCDEFRRYATCFIHLHAFTEPFFFLSWPEVAAHAVKLLGTHFLETCFKGNFERESHSLSGATTTLTLSDTTWRRYCRGEPLLPHHPIQNPRYLVLWYSVAHE